MAKEKKTRARTEEGKFEKGVSGNPNGRPRLEYNETEAKNYTRVQILRAMNEVMGMPRMDVDQLCDKDVSPYASGAQALMASVLSKAILMGCPTRAQFFMSYLFGRPKEYDPSDDEKAFDPKKSLNGIPSDVIIKALHEQQKAREGAAG